MKPDLDGISRILIRGVNWLGDAIMTTPALLRLREACPQARLVLATPAKLADLYLRHPALDEVIPLVPRDSLWAASRRLKTQSFDLAVLFPNSPRSALEVWLARIPRRLGYAHPWRTWLLSHPVPRPAAFHPMAKKTPGQIRRLLSRNQAGARPVVPEKAHHLYHYLHLVAALGANPEPLAPRIEVGTEEIEACNKKFGFAADPAISWLGINPGAEYGPAKRWPWERFAETMSMVAAQTACGWLLLGGGGDAELCARIERAFREGLARNSTHPPHLLNLAGRTTLRELCAVLKKCRLLITNDTGPMHVAAAVGTPVAAIFGSTSPELTGPGLPNDPHHRIIRHTPACAPCFLRQCPADNRCLSGITPAQLVPVLLGLLRQPSAP